MPGKHRQSLGAAIAGRRQARQDIADDAVALVEADEAPDIARAVERTQFATGLEWPTTKEQQQ